MLIHATTWDNTGGYGRLACEVLRALGFKARITSDMPIPGELLSFAGGGSHKASLTISPPYNPVEAPVAFTMYESTKLPAELVINLNRRRLIIVPCAQNKDAFKSSGVRSKIEICNLSCTPKYELPYKLSPFIFTHVSADHGILGRKRVNEIVTAFTKAFPREKDVRLILKRSDACAPIITFDSRIEVITEKCSIEDIRDLYIDSHCGVFISGQEAWGYPHIDLMATGRPIIAPYYGGPAEYLDATCGYLLDYKLSKVPNAHFRGIGNSGYGSIKSLISAFRFCYDNKEDAILKGVMAYRKSLGFSFNRFTTRLNQIFDENSKLFKV